MKGDHEFTGTLLGFDDFVSKWRDAFLRPRVEDRIDMVLEDVTE